MTEQRRLWIEEPGDEETTELSRVTKTWRKQGRPTPGIMAAMKLAPNALANVMRMNNAVTFGGSTLGRVREELIAATTSALNDCFY